MAGMHVQTCIALTLLSVLYLTSYCDGEVGGVDFHGMKVRELKAYIAGKGTECLACSSKEDLIARALEVEDWPTVEAESSKEKQPTEEELERMFQSLNSDKERTAKAHEDLRKAGLDPEKFGGKVYSAEELQKMFKKGDGAKTEL